MEQDAIMRFNGDESLMEKWYAENLITRPTQQWYDDIAEIYDELTDLFGQDPFIQEYHEQRNRLIRPYKENGKFMPKYATEELINELDELEDALMDYLSSKEKSKLSFVDKQKYLTLKMRLDSLVSKKPSKKYNELYKSKTDSLYASYNLMMNAKTKLIENKSDEDFQKFEFYQTQFNNEEAEYEKWYNLHHENKYQSIKNGFNLKDSSNPKSFNYERVPHQNVYEQYTEKVENPKYYTIKRLKEEAYNPDFLKSPDGIPMPNSIYKHTDGSLRIIPGMENSLNINENYKALMKDNELFEFYNALMDMNFSLQKKIEGKTIGYMVPGIAESRIQSISSAKSMNDFVKKQTKIFVDKNFKLASEQDTSENMFGNLGTDKIRMGFSSQLSEDLQSTDAIGCALEYALECHNNIAKQEAAPIMNSAIQFLKLQRSELEKISLSGEIYKNNPDGTKSTVDIKKRLKELDNVIGLYEFERRKFIAGQSETAMRAGMKKALNNFFLYTSFIRIGYDIANQTKNYVAGNTAAFIAASNFKSDHYSQKDFGWAKREVYKYGGFIHNFFSDYGKITDLHESTMLYRLFNPMMKNERKYYENAGKSRRIKEKLLHPMELGFMLQDKGDAEIGITVMYAVMHKYKFAQIDAQGNEIKDADGNPVLIPVHDIYIKSANGQLVKRTDVKYSESDENMIRQIIYSEMRRAQGNYAKTDQTKIEEKIIGKMMYFFKKFLVPQLLNRFGYLRPNWEAQEAAMGYWVALFKANKYFGAKATLSEFILGANLTKKIGVDGLNMMNLTKDDGSIEKEEIGDIYQKKVAQARRDAIAMVVLMILSYLALGWLRRKKDDDEEINMLQGNAFRVLWQTKQELTSMNPLTGSDDYIRNFTQIIPFMREFTAGKKFVDHGIKLVAANVMGGGEVPDPDYDSEVYQQIYKDAYYQHKTGVYQKGEAKFVKDLVDLTGIRNIRDLFEPTGRIEQMKRNN